MNKKVFSLILPALFLGACFHQPPLNPTSEEKVVILNEFSDSGQMGTATLQNVAEGLLVKIEVNANNPDGPQPAHIHAGNCPEIGPVVYNLNDVSDGVSETTLETTLEDLLNNNRSLNINIHYSYNDFPTYTVCGDIL
jgi:hypothetical protein